MLEVSEDVVKKRLSRARERMRNSVEAALGSALIATAPTIHFSVSFLGAVSAPKFLQRLRSLSKLRLISTPIRLLGVTAAAVAVASTPQFKTWMRSTRLVMPARAPEIHGTVLGHKNATGTASLDCTGDFRTVNIEHGSFDARDLPPGKCHVTLNLDGGSSPASQDLTLHRNELYEYRINYVKGAGPSPSVVATPEVPTLDEPQK